MRLAHCHVRYVLTVPEPEAPRVSMKDLGGNRGPFTCPGHLHYDLGGQPGRVWEGPMVWSQLLLGSKVGGLWQVMS